MRKVHLICAMAFLTVATSCSESGDQVLLVSAAASLTEAFQSFEEAFEESHPGVDIVLNLGGSSTLREQILDGAPADVFASADLANMETLVESGHTDGTPLGFATNALQIAVPAGNPGEITGLADFAKPDLLLGLCAEGVPCGDLARQVLSRAGVTPSIDTNEPDVRSLLAKVEAGELDAAITYSTDVMSTNGRVQGVDIHPDNNVVAFYPIALLREAGQPDLGREFIEFVLSADGQAILLAHGFGSP